MKFEDMNAMQRHLHNAACVLDGDGDEYGFVELLREAIAELGQQASDPLRDLISKHGDMLEGNPYCYFELAYTRRTEWMAWLCSKPSEDDPQRVVLAKGQGGTPDEAAADALGNMTPNANSTNRAR